jgi:Fe2+ or Zn2+ uptake regulation protein
VQPKQDLVRLFRERGLRVTPQRESVFEVLSDLAMASGDVHPTADHVWMRARHRMPSVSLKTIYLILHDLVDLGQIRQIDLGTGSSLFDLSDAPHHHLLCCSCGRLWNIEAEARSYSLSPRHSRFEVTSVDVVLRGTCEDCRAPAAPAERQALSAATRHR